MTNKDKVQTIADEAFADFMKIKDLHENKKAIDYDMYDRRVKTGGLALKAYALEWHHGNLEHKASVLSDKNS